MKERRAQREQLPVPEAPALDTEPAPKFSTRERRMLRKILHADPAERAKRLRDLDPLLLEKLAGEVVEDLHSPALGDPLSLTSLFLVLPQRAALRREYEVETPSRLILLEIAIVALSRWLSLESLMSRHLSGAAQSHWAIIRLQELANRSLQQYYHAIALLRRDGSGSGAIDLAGATVNVVRGDQTVNTIRGSRM